MLLFWIIYAIGSILAGLLGWIAVVRMDHKYGGGGDPFLVGLTAFASWAGVFGVAAYLMFGEDDD